MSKLILYHGSPHKFSRFKNILTFFSDEPKFAIKYSDEKISSNSALHDSNTYIYTVEFNGKIFDMNKHGDSEKLERLLPDEIKCYGSGGFSKTFNKTEYVQLLKGFNMKQPLDFTKNVNIGDSIKLDKYDDDTLVVKDIDDDYVYCYDLDTYSDYRNKCINGFEFSKISDFLHTNKIKYDNKHKVFRGDFAVPDDIKGEFNKLKDEFNSCVWSKIYISKYNRKPMIEKKEDTWVYYENDITPNLIKELGYDGYVALEKGQNTYCIFNPIKTAKIIDIKCT